jgi:hypothetical protein
VVDRLKGFTFFLAALTDLITSTFPYYMSQRRSRVYTSSDATLPRDTVCAFNCFYSPALRAFDIEFPLIFSWGRCFVFFNVGWTRMDLRLGVVLLIDRFL